MAGLLDLFTGGEQPAPQQGMTPEEQAQQEAFSRRARMDQFGQIGAVLFAAGQKQMPEARAQALQNLGPALGSYSQAMQQQQKAQLEALQVARARQELVRDRQFREMLPKYTEALQKAYPGITPEMIASLPKENIIKLVQDALQSPEKKKMEALQIQKLEQDLSTQWDKVEQEDANGYKKVFFVNKRNPSEVKTLDQILTGGGGTSQPAPAAPVPGVIPGMPKAYNEARMKQLAEVDTKEVLDLDKATQAGGQALRYLDQALELSKTAYAGPLSGARGYITSQFGNQRGIDTENMNNVVVALALENLKAVFGSTPTEGERKILLEVQGSSSKAPEVRNEIFRRAKEAAENRIKFNRETSGKMRSGTYLMPQPAQGQTSVPVYDPATGRWE